MFGTEKFPGIKIRPLARKQLGSANEGGLGVPSLTLVWALGMVFGLPPWSSSPTCRSVHGRPVRDAADSRIRPNR